MRNSSKISGKGQITVPQEILKRLGLEPADRVEFVAEEGRTVIRPVRSEANPFEKFLGTMGAVPRRGKAWIDDMRSDKD